MKQKLIIGRWLIGGVTLLAVIIVGGIILYNKKTTPEEVFLSNGGSLVETRELLNKGLIDDGINLASKLLQEHPGDVIAMSAYAEALLQKGSLEFKEKQYGEQGLELADEIIKINPNFAEGYFVRGYAYEIMDKYKESLIAYEEYAVIKEDAKILNQMGHVYDLMGDIERANEFYERAYTKDNKYLEASLNLARVHLRRGELKKAESLYKKLLDSVAFKNNRNKAEAWQALSEIDFQNGDIDLALVAADKSINIDKTFSLSYVQKAKLLILTQQKYNEAIDLLNKAVELNLNQTAAYEWRGLANLEKGLYQLSINDFVKAINTVDRDITIMESGRMVIKSRNLYQLSLVQALNGQVQEGYDNLLKAMTSVDKRTFSSMIDNIIKGVDGSYANLMNIDEFVELRNDLLK